MRKTTPHRTRRGSKLENKVDLTEQNSSKLRTNTRVKETRKGTSEINVTGLEGSIATITSKTDRTDSAVKSMRAYVPTTTKCESKLIEVIKHPPLKEDEGCNSGSSILASPNVGNINQHGQETSWSLTQADKQIKEILRDDNFFSSPYVGEVVCDVQWECTSPDVCKQLLRKNNRNKKTVSEIALGLRVSDDQIHANETETTPEPFLGLWIQDQNNSEKSTFKPRRILGKRSALRKKEKAAKTLPEKYQILLEKLNSEQSLEKKVKEEKTSKERGAFDDLYDQLFSNEDQLLTTGLVRCIGNSPPITGNDSWSDDDLFKEDSFIVAATQMPIEMLSEMCNNNKRKRESLGLSGKCAKDTKINIVTKDMNNNKGCVVGLDKQSINRNASSYESNCLYFNKSDPKNDFIKNKELTTFTINSSKPKSNNIQISTLTCSPAESTVLPRKTFHGNSLSTFRKHNSFSESPTSRLKEKNQLPNISETTSPFRKHNSFDACPHYLTSTPTMKSSSKNIQEPRILKPDIFSSQSCVSNCYEQKVYINTNQSLWPQIKEESCKWAVMDSRDTVKIKKEDSFLDTSISDEILTQLDVHGEILKSQPTSDGMPLTPAPIINSAEQTLALLFEEDISFSEVQTESRKNFYVAEPEPQYKRYSDINHDFSKKPVSELNIHGNLTKPIHGMNQNVNEFIKTEENESNCNQGKYSFTNVTKDTVINTGIVPSKNAQSVSYFGDASDISDIDLILGTHEFFNDNSFLNEDSLLESQFLAELDRIESTL